MVAEAGLGGQVELHTDGSVGALVEAVEIDRPLGRRRDLVAHSTVLNTMAAHGPVLPMRFGSVVDGERAVVEELLAPQQEHFLEMLDQVAGHVQFTLRAHYVLDTVLAEIVAADPEIAQLRRETADLPEDATHFKRIRLGELVSKAVDARRRADAEDLISRIAPVVEDWVAREVAGMDTMADYRAPRVLGQAGGAGGGCRGARRGARRSRPAEPRRADGRLRLRPGAVTWA